MTADNVIPFRAEWPDPLTEARSIRPGDLDRILAEERARHDAWRVLEDRGEAIRAMSFREQIGRAHASAESAITVALTFDARLEAVRAYAEGLAASQDTGRAKPLTVAGIGRHLLDLTDPDPDAPSAA